MADSKLSNLPQGMLPNLWYGDDSGGVSKKFHALDWHNVVDFGADPTGATDSTSAIQAAIDWTTANENRGTVYFPVGNYVVTGTIRLDTAGAGTGQNVQVRLLGAGANPADPGGGTAALHSRIFGNVAGYIFFATSISAGSANKVFDSLYITNVHPAGGCIYIENTNHNLVRDCGISGHYGITFHQCNAPSMCHNVAFNGGFYGLYLGGTGCHALGCDGSHYGDCIRMVFGGNAVYSGRFEVSTNGINVGASMFDQEVTSYAINGSGNCRLLVGSTINFTATGQSTVTIAGATGTTGLNGAGVAVSVFDATHLDTTIPFTGSDGTTTISVPHSATGFVIEGCTFESNDTQIRLTSGSAGVIQGCQFEVTQGAPAGYGKYGILMIGAQYIKINANIGGAAVVGGFLTTLDTNSLVANNDFSLNSFAAVLSSSGTITPATPQHIDVDFHSTGLTMPPWVVVGAFVSDTTSNRIPAGTTVTAVTSTQITISAQLTATLDNHSNLSFSDANNALGAIYLHKPNGLVNYGYDIVTTIANNATLSEDYTYSIESTATGNITLTVNNDAYFSMSTRGSPKEFKITQTGSGSITVSAGTATVRTAVAGTSNKAIQYQVLILRRISGDTWIVSQGS